MYQGEEVGTAGVGPLLAQHPLEGGGECSKGRAPSITEARPSKSTTRWG